MRRRLIIVGVLGCAFLSVIRSPVRTFFQPVAVVVPHHNIVAAERRQFYARISSLRPETNSIILLSPDHFSTDQKEIFYSDRDWNLQDGKLEYDRILGNTIAGAGYLNPYAVEKDHGIYNQLSDIKTYFPKARIVPFIIGDHVPQSRLDSFTNLIIQNCLSDCLLVASVDFSHYLPEFLADIHDLYAQKILLKLDTGNYQNLEVDSPQSLYLVMQMAKARKAFTFNLFAHTNSGHILNSPDAESTSHVFASYSRVFSPAKFPDLQTFTFASGLSRALSQKGVGDHFFYGVDYLNPQLSASFSASPWATVSPGRESSLNLVDGRLQIEIGSDLAVAGVKTSGADYVLLLPLDTSASAFLRSTAKLKVLEDLFSRIYSSPEIKIDVKSGIIYLQRS